MRPLFALLWLFVLSCGLQPTAPPFTPLPGAQQPSTALATELTRALTAKGPGYVPRTHHLEPDGQPTYTNRLILETSPYLLQHAHNPVDWSPWGDEAFERARTQDKPVLLSVGYSTCHWCHVMERESFEDVEIARFINEHFVPIKVDREERPDVDAVYMKAVQAMTRRGGWPMTVVMTPDSRQPFFAGTYFPPRTGARGARTGFLEILTQLDTAWATDRDTLIADAGRLSEHMAQMARPPHPSGLPTHDALDRAAAHFASTYDRQHGGFGNAPKFPRPSELTFLLRQHARTGDPGSRDMALHTLRAMAAGGLRDQIGGGFHRYSVDAQWRVPHFEKMLYDQAQLTWAYLDAYQLTGDDQYAAVARDTLDYVATEMIDADGGFHSATDADSPTPQGHDEEGYFFTWTVPELQEALGDDAPVAIAWWAATDAGNFEGRNILHTPRARSDVAASLQLDVETLDATVQRSRRSLYEARALRPPPIKDDKVIAAWNGLMISAFARGSFLLDSPRYGEVARDAARFCLSKMSTPEGLHRTWRDGRSRHEGVLTDYAFLALGLLDLFEATGEAEWLRHAQQLTGRMDARFGDDTGGWYRTAADSEALLTRDKPWYDGAEPSGNAAAVLVHLRLHALTADDVHRVQAEKALALFGTPLARSGASAPLMLQGLDLSLDDPKQVVLVPGEGIEDLMAVLRDHFVPGKVQIPLTRDGASATQQAVALAADKIAIDGKATAYVCRQGLCEQPATSPALFQAQLTAEPAP